MDKKSKIEEVNIYSDTVNEVLSTPPPLLLSSGNYLILAVLIIFVALGLLIRFPDVVPASGIVTTANSPLTLVAQSSGRIQYVTELDNSLIDSNSIICVISSDEDYRDIQVLKRLLSKLVRNEQEAADSLLQFIPGSKVGPMAMNSARLQTLIQRRIAHGLEYTVDAQINLLNQQIEEYRKALKTRELERKLAIERIDLLEVENQRSKSLLKDKVISAREAERAEYELSIEKSQFSNINSDVQNIYVGIRSVENQIAQLSSGESRSFKDIELAISEVVNQLLAEIKVWNAAHMIIAPFSGILTRKIRLEKNQHVNEIDELFTLSPENSQYVIKGILPFNKSGLVEIGQKVIVKLQQFPYREYGVMNARIDDISYTPSDQGYLFTAQLENGNTTEYGKKLEFRPEMPASLEVVLEDASLMERIFYEIRSIFSG
ncbi:hypothetical protein CEQ90_05805 [Lewinellaceae bacterium SD302]|nr:hypothetical protein CEQ90_05805 [Lewinellaceae bacterium SD302]